LSLGATNRGKERNTVRANRQKWNKKIGPYDVALDTWKVRSISHLLHWTLMPYNDFFFVHFVPLFRIGDCSLPVLGSHEYLHCYFFI
jgi:hypothetical protein